MLLIHICCNSWGENMFWLFGTVKKYPEKNLNMNIVHFVLCGLSLTTVLTVNRGADKIGFMQWCLFLRLPLTLSEKKTALQYKGEKSCYCLLFHNLEILCSIVTFFLWPIISSTATISKQFGCKLEENMLYCSHKTSLAGKDGFVVEVDFVPIHFFKKKKKNHYDHV